MDQRDVRMDPVLLHAAIVDGINRYVREVLEANHLLNAAVLPVLNEGELLRRKHEIAASVVEAYRFVREIEGE